MKAKELKNCTLQIIAKEWHDKKNGNTYFSAIIYKDNKPIIKLPFQYGYNSCYEDIALGELKKLGLVDYSVFTFSYLEEKKNVSLLSYKDKNCLRKEVFNFGLLGKE